jgi:hypothetical protein
LSASGSPAVSSRGRAEGRMMRRIAKHSQVLWLGAVSVGLLLWEVVKWLM